MLGQEQDVGHSKKIFKMGKIYIVYGRHEDSEVFEEVGRTKELPVIEDWVSKPLPLIPRAKQVANQVKYCELIVTKNSAERIWHNF